MTRIIKYLLLLTVLSSLLSAQTVKTVNVGVIFDGDWSLNDSLISVIKTEVEELLSGEFNVIFRKDKEINGDWKVEKMKEGIAKLLEDPEIDIILTAGEISSGVAIFFNKEFTKPVIAPFAANAELQNMPMQNGTSGVKNLNYITFSSSLPQQIKMFKQLKDFKKAALLINELYFVDLGGDNAGLSSKLFFDNTTFIPITISQETNKLSAPIPDDADAIIISPIFYLEDNVISDIILNYQNKQRPVYGIFYGNFVNLGAIAASSPSEFFPRISRRIALNMQRILLGEEPGSIGIDFTIDEQLMINMSVVKKLGIYPDWSLMSSSILTNDIKKNITRKLSLFDVLSEAEQVNLSLKQKKKAVEIAHQDYRSARSNLLPKLDLSATGLLIDNKSAENSSGQQAEKTISGTLTLSQLIFNEKAWANLDIQDINENLTKIEEKKENLDIIFEAGKAFMDLLRAKNYEVVQKENLKVSTSNLEIARYRELVGNANASEVYRWENQIASNRKSVIEAVAQRNLAEINLNTMLNRPTEESFIVLENKLTEIIYKIADQRISFYYDNKWHFKIFRDFVSLESINNSPEIHIIDKAIEIQKRSLTSSNRSFFTPTLSFQAQAKNVFYRGGAGSEVSPTFIPGLGELSLVNPPEDFTWNVALNLSLPLFEGTQRFVDVDKASLEIARLELQKKEITQAIEQNIRSTIHLAGSSYAGMEQANLSAEAASKNLELVKDAYQRGAVSIIGLIDAQNASLTADLLAVNSRYEFLIDMMSVERATGEYKFKMTKAEREDFFKRLKLYFDENIGK